MTATARVEVPIHARLLFLVIFYSSFYLCTKYVRSVSLVISNFHDVQFGGEKSAQQSNCISVMFACGADKGILHCPQFVIGIKIALHCARAHKVQFYQAIFRLRNVLQNSDIFGILHSTIPTQSGRPMRVWRMTNQGSGRAWQ